MKTTLSLNNSGGFDWVDPQTLIDGDEEEARESLEHLTGYDGHEKGCECCGAPFYFREYYDV